ncbi:RDD family protein [Bisbaumannia pacifica]|uniref:RDD family protein n=1 Tax=Bisbaumannia pacifica TaxID=77098 RepID=A0ABD4KWT1_9GAMM|nr:RDD family protein [Halomonas pacifica]MBH8578804.1 RDD family protein [Halomonas pacifica]
MGDFWIKIGGKARGPYPLGEISRMRKDEKISDDHEIWVSGMEGWKPIRKIVEEPFFVTLKSNRRNRNHEVGAKEMAQAGPWRRFLARIFDVWASISLVLAPSVFAIAYLFPEIYLSIYPANEVWAGIVFLFLAIMVDALVYFIFGNTLGKALLGVKVIGSDGAPLKRSDYWVRNLGVWWSGLALGIPLLSLIAMVVQYRRLSSKGFASYDAYRKPEVIVEGGSAFKTVVFVFLFLIFAFTNMVLSGV